MKEKTIDNYIKKRAEENRYKTVFKLTKKHPELIVREELEKEIESAYKDSGRITSLETFHKKYLKDLVDHIND